MSASVTPVGSGVGTTDVLTLVMVTVPPESPGWGPEDELDDGPTGG
jgi:hypothetical protein